jgi:hypothetical protein
MSTKNYLGREELSSAIGFLQLTMDDLISSDNYDEVKLLEKFKKYSPEDATLMYKAAIQLSVIGYGQQNYGAVRLNDTDIINLVDIFRKLNIKYNNRINERYSDDDFSVRRLLRFFRYQIQAFIIKSQRPSYLWLKYSDRDPKYLIICFPGAEHLVETRDEANYLLKTYQNLDNTLNTRFVDRLRRVFIARKIFAPLEFIQPKTV